MSAIAMTREVMRKRLCLVVTSQGPEGGSPTNRLHPPHAQHLYQIVGTASTDGAVKFSNERRIDLGSARVGLGDGKWGPNEPVVPVPCRALNAGECVSGSSGHLKSGTAVISEIVISIFPDKCPQETL